MSHSDTHYACDTRIKAEGGKAHCCECSPHEGCDVAPPQPQEEDELDIEVLPDIFRAIGPGDDVVVSAEKLLEWRNTYAKAYAKKVGLQAVQEDKQ